MSREEIPPLFTLEGVGPKLTELLERLDLFDLRDLLLHLPLRYEDRSEITPMARLEEGRPALVEGEVLACEVVGRKRPHLLCRLIDRTGALNLRFFTTSRNFQSRLLPGSRLRCYGVPRLGSLGFEMVHPQLLSQEEPLAIVPVYPSTTRLSQRTLRRLVGQALAQLEEAPWLPELPVQLWERYGLPPLSLKEALSRLHFPERLEETEPVRRRLAFEELLAYRIGLRWSRNLRMASSAPRCRLSKGLLEAFRARLPFRLTPAQERVIGELLEDLAEERPMGRLLQGEVGSGKTVVAAAAALAVWESGWQTALMAPTELLAEQHFRNFQEWLAPLGVRIGLLTSSVRGQARRELLERLAEGELDLLIGTHALFQRGVRYRRLGLVIVDEQHRFGVHQRFSLKLKGGERAPHYLVMTATPIPRTLAMLRYGDLELSVLDQLPPGRKPVQTRILPESRRGELLARLRRWLGEGRQAYWICTLIESSERLEAQALQETLLTLRKALCGFEVEAVHGRMGAEEKEAVMRRFREGEIAVLVGTTVVEVGVDVPGASLIVIENAERLGLSQLHQLRGRVGRGEQESYCILLYRPPLSAVARQRLLYIRDHHDGFAIAEKDLELRGPGEVFGTRQSGELRFRIADLSRDRDLLAKLPEAAREVEPLLEGERRRRFLRFWLREGLFYGEV